MKRFIPFAVLVLLTAAGCDRSPVGPDMTSGETAPAVMNVSPNPFTMDFSYSFDMCGYAIVDCELTFHYLAKRFDDAAGGNHLQSSIRYRGLCTSQSTGEQWRYVSGNNTQSQWKDAGQDEYTYWNSTTVYAGLAGAPTFVGQQKGHYAVNANGDRVTDHYFEARCIEPGS